MWIVRNKSISIIGSDCIIGKGLQSLSTDFKVVFHHTSELDWKHPYKVASSIMKGFPDVYILCYSAYDRVENHLCEIARILTKAATNNKAKVIGFVSDKIYEGLNVKLPIDEAIEPRPFSPSARAEFVFEQTLLKYPNSLVFRLGEYYDNVSGLPRQMLNQIMSDPKLKIDETSLFSLTSRVTLAQAIKRGIEYDMIHRFQLADQGGVTQRDLYDLLKVSLSGYKFQDQERFIKGEGYRVFDCIKWETMSMTKSVPWTFHLKNEIPNIVSAIYGIKQ
jgi:dTDP-4-dehydrorhamnose reductase